MCAMNINQQHAITDTRERAHKYHTEAGGHIKCAENRYVYRYRCCV